MHARRLLASLCLFAATLQGCVDHAPAYKEALLAYDDALVGEWNFRPEIGEPGTEIPNIPVSVRRREASITAGRLGDHNEPNPDPKRVVPAYTFTVTLPKSEEDKPAPAPRSYDAVLLTIGGARFLAYQLGANEPPVADYFGDVLPVHRVLRLEHSGDTLRVSSLKARLVWLPTVRSAYDASRCPPLPETEGNWFVENPDHLATLLEQAAARSDLWEAPMILTRAQP